MVSGPRVLIVTPLMPPAPGGGGVYTDLLARGLAQHIGAASVTVLTEAFPGQEKCSSRMGDRVKIRRVYPYRAGSSKKGVASYIGYAVQQLQFFGLPRLIDRDGIDVVLFHSSFFYHPGLAGTLVRNAIPRSRALWIADVRDPLLSPAAFPVLYPFDAIIACSENVRQHLARDPALAPKVRLVPIPVAADPGSREFRASVLRQHGLSARSYVFSSSGIVLRKGIDDAIASVRLARRVAPELSLVVVGKARDQSPRHREAEQEGVLRYLGIVDHSTSLALAREALVDLNLSQVDSMPRGSLESLCVGTPILVPPGIPELEACCGEAVVEPTDHESVAQRILALRVAPRLPAYDTSAHTVENVARATAEVFQISRRPRFLV